MATEMIYESAQQLADALDEGRITLDVFQELINNLMVELGIMDY